MGLEIIYADLKGLKLIDHKKGTAHGNPHYLRGCAVPESSECSGKGDFCSTFLRHRFLEKF